MTENYDNNTTYRMYCGWSWRRPWHGTCGTLRSGRCFTDADYLLHMPAYQAIGIALASDVLASGVSAWTYKKNKNIDIRHGVIMLISVLILHWSAASYLRWCQMEPWADFRK